MWYKRTIPLILVFLIGILGFTIEYVPHYSADRIRLEITTAFQIISGFGLFIGAYSLLHMHISRIRRRQRAWGYSAFVFVGAAIMIVVGIWNDGQGPMRPSVEGGVFEWLYLNVQVPCSATIFSILAFFIASAAYRTFRAKNIEALLLLAAAIVVMFGRVPISEWLSANILGPRLVFSKAADALMNFPNLASQRGILLGIALGGISQSLRILFGIERAYMGGGD